MCGVAGIVAKPGSHRALPSQLRQMADALRHRGPDDEGYAFFGEETTVLAGGNDTPEAVYKSGYTYKPVTQISEIQSNYSIGLGHRRLSIIDPSPAGHQPMSYQDEKLWLVFNGEIYNYKEIRERLISFGITFLTQTDSEVLLAAYAYWGEACLQYFNGMWSFVIYDKIKNILFGARDRFGVKPFYYFNNNAFFAFASEQKALLKLKQVKGEINDNAAFEYLALGRTETFSQGLFNNIIELMPGHSFNFKINTSELTLKKYYSLQSNKHWEAFEEKKNEQITEKTRGLLFDAVKKRLRADVSIGTCLSGGVDSSALVCVIDELMKKKSYDQLGTSQKVFTASYHNDIIDESRWAKKVVDATKTSWHQIYADSAGLLGGLEDLSYFQDIPILGTSTYSQYCVMRRVAEEGVRVTLDGQGADELFSGYAPHFVSYFYEAAKNGSIREMRNSLIDPHPGFSDKNNLLTLPAKHLATNIFFSHFKNGAFKKTRREFNYINVDFWERNKGVLSILKGGFHSSLGGILQHQFTGADLKVLLRTGDRNSMRFSIESRMPFADDIDLIEYIFNIPSAYKIRNGQSKSLLRNAVKGLLPEAVRLRKDKLGFATPEYRWLNEIKAELRQYITPELDQFVDTKSLLKDWDSLFLNSTPGATHRLFRLVNFAVWKKVFKL